MRFIVCTFFCAVFFWCWSSVNANDDNITSKRITVSVDGIERVASIHRPVSHGDGGVLPVVLVFHGGGQDSAKIAEITGFNRIADREGFLAVYPEGVNHRWNDGRKLTGIDAKSLVDDVSFVSKLIDELESKWKADPSRIYATGFSNGGIFCQRLGCMLSDRIAAIAPVSASMSAEQFKQANATGPVNVVMFFGTKDPIEPWTGGDVKFGGNTIGQIAGVEDVIKFWVNNNHCAAEPVRGGFETSAGTAMPVGVTTYVRGLSNTMVTLYRIDGGGHTWPGTEPDKRSEEGTYGKTSNLQASELIWKFFSECKKTKTSSGVNVDLNKLESLSGGELGAYAVDLASGKIISLHADDPFPLASVVKLPIAIAFLKLIDEGKYKLTDRLHLKRADMYEVGHSPLSENFPVGGLTINYAELLKQSICESDTTAGEVLLDKAGGPAAVQRMLNDAGCTDVRVSDSECMLILDYNGVERQKVKQWDKKTIDELIGAVPERGKVESARRFMLSPGNTATPRAMADLLSKLEAGRLLKVETTSYLLSLLRQTNTWPNRIKGQLPPSVVVAHKTGTWGTTGGVNAATNDVGIITAPDSGGRICLAVFVKGSSKKMPERELAIASFARYAFKVCSSNPTAQSETRR